MCQGSHDAVQALRDCNASFHAIDVQADPEIRAYLPKFCSMPGLPQLFLQGELIGGSDIVVDLWRQGELGAMLDECQPVRAIAS
jgi:monothiol glutaredoxin